MSPLDSDVIVNLGRGEDGERKICWVLNMILLKVGMQRMSIEVFFFFLLFIDLNVSMYSIRMIYGKDFKDIPNN